MYATLPNLKYDYSALEPHIDTKTMTIHHTKHHALYVEKLNGVIEKNKELESQNIQDLLKNINNLKISEGDKTILRNHGGGHLNHTLFFDIIGPEKAIDENLTARIKNDFSSVETLKEELTQTALNRFGSGWAWLVDSNGTLKIYSTPNQDSPYMQGDTPIIGIDVWEHAYYLKYQNLRADYIKAFFKVLKILE
jgi:Fe-Mn family superoxide dismutase